MPKNICKIIAVLFISGLMIFWTAGSAAEQESFKVGVTVPMTGPMAIIGECFINGIRFADRAYDPQDKVKFLFEDDQYQSKVTASAVNKFISVDKVQALIVFGSGPSLAVSSIVERKGVPTISMSSSPEVVKGKSFIVKHWLEPRVESAIALSYAKKLGYRSFALITTENDAMLAIREKFLALKPDNVKGDEYVNPGDTDLREVAYRSVNAGADAVYMIMTPPQPGILAKRLRELNYQGEIFAAHPVDIDSIVRDPNGPLVGSWYITADDRPATEFLREYEKHYKKVPVTGAANGHDIAKLIIEGLKTKDLNSFLHTVKDFKGAFGVYGANGKNGFNVPAAVRRVTKSGIVYVKDGESDG